MKKILLGTSALIAAFSMAASASAETPTVKLGGYIDFQAGYVSDDYDTAQHGHGFRNETRVDVSVDGKSDQGLGYGAFISLEADATGNSDTGNLNANKTFVYLDGNWGRFELGTNTDVATALKVDAASIAHGTGGIDGDWYKFANDQLVPTGFIIRPDLPMSHNEATENATKINYYTPRFSGFQLGASYTPDSGDKGQTVARSDNTLGQAQDVFTGGINYANEFSGVGVALSATGEIGNSESSLLEDLGAYALGAKLSYMGWSLAGSYGNWSDSLNVNNADADYWTAGLAYDGGPFGASVTYLNSEFGNNDFENWSIGADYKLAPGLTPYAEVNFYEQDASSTLIPDNDGTTVLIGTELAF